MMRAWSASPTVLRAGIALSIIAGAAWAAGRAITDRMGHRLVNWEWAARVAAVASRTGPVEVSWAHGPARQRYAALVGRSYDLVAAYSGVTLPEPLTNVHVFDRIEWINANIANFRILFDSLERAYQAALQRTSAAGALSGLGQVVLSGEVGALLGYLARRVLGQYDISLLGREPVTAGQLYFVEPNILHFERRHGLPPDDFRFWIALHEVTHAFEFEAHPWVRVHMNALLTTYLASLARDLFGDRGELPLAAFVERVRANLSTSRHPLEIMMSAEQRRVFWSLQALMALMEGYSNHVMQQVGRQHLPSYERLRLYFEERMRRRGPAEQLFIRLTGLDLKLEQYALGERFVNTIVAARGIEAMNRVWEGPGTLPTLAEIRQPGRWVARIEQQTVAADAITPV